MGVGVGAGAEGGQRQVRVSGCERAALRGGGASRRTHLSGTRGVGASGWDCQQAHPGGRTRARVWTAAGSGSGGRPCTSADATSSSLMGNCASQGKRGRRLVCLDVRGRRAVQAGQPQPHLDGARGGVSVSGCEGPQGSRQQFQAGQPRTLMAQEKGLVCLDVRACRARKGISRRANGAPAAATSAWPPRARRWPPRPPAGPRRPGVGVGEGAAQGELWVDEGEAKGQGEG